MKRIVCIRLLKSDCNVPALVEHCGRFSPIVGLEPTDGASILLDVTGLAHLFGGEAALAAQIVDAFHRLGLNICVAIADTIGAAWAAVYHCNLQSSLFVILPSGTTAAFLSALPLAALRLPEDVVRLLSELGITQIGHLAMLPREELASRFGTVLAKRMDQALGRLDEPVPVCPLPPKFAVDWSAEYPTARRETIEAAVAHLTGRLAAMLADRGLGALRLECELKAGARPIRMSVGLFRPTAAAAHLFQLLQLQLERLRIPSPISAIRVTAPLTAPLEPCRQTMLFDPRDDGPGPQHRRQLAVLVERLSSRLGRRAVARVRLRPEAQPELSWHYDPLVDRPRHSHVRKVPPAELPPRPLRLLPRPMALVATSIAPEGPPLWFHFAGCQHKIAHRWGPERIETGWWRGHPVGRDYFGVETAAGSRFWLFRRLRDGKWFLHGMFE